MKDVTAYGADPTGVADCTAAVESAYAASGPNVRAIYFPAGRYMFSQQVRFGLAQTGNVPVQSITIAGDGPDTTELFWPNGGGIYIELAGEFQGFHVRDMALTTGVLGGGSALSVTQLAGQTNHSDITRVVTRGMDGYQQNFGWDNGLNLMGVFNLTIDKCYLCGPNSRYGTGIYVSSTQQQPSAITNITDCIINFFNAGTIYGPYFQGMTIKGTNYNSNLNGIVQTTPGTFNDQLIVSGCQFGNPAAGGSSIVLQDMQDALITHNLFLCNGSLTTWHIAILGNAQRFVATGNSFLTGVPAVISGGAQGAQYGVFVGNNLMGCDCSVNGATGWQIGLNT